MPIFYYASRSELPLNVQLNPWPLLAQAEEAMKQIGDIVESAEPSLWVNKPTGPEMLVPTFVIETILEDLRGKEFSDKPTRLLSVHLAESEADAVEFSMEYRQYSPRPYIYEIVTDHEATVFRGDQGLINVGFSNHAWADPVGELEGIRARARRYWAGERTRNPFIEVLSPHGSNRVNRLARLLDRRIPPPVGQPLPSRDP